MKAARITAEEADRLTALHEIGLLDTPPEPSFDIFPSLARELFQAPIAAISLVDTDRQWFKAIQGLDVTETPREQSFCAHAIRDPDSILVVPDARADPRFADNPLVTGEPGIRFYAGAPVFDAAGRPLGALCVIDRVPREVTPAALTQLRQLARAVSSTLQLHAAMHKLRSLALTDALTGLANRAGFLQRGVALLSRLPPGRQAALFYLDLDRFKPINDLFGHTAGDAALLEAAKRIRRVVRAEDLVARLGGDEFALLISGLRGAEEAEAIAGRLHAALADTFTLSGKPVPLRTSIGVALADRAGASLETLLAEADAALSLAKHAGRGQTRRADDLTGPGPAGPPVGRGSIEAELRSALASADPPFRLLFQPYWRSGDGTLIGREALVRWDRHGEGEMLPTRFVPVAEATGLIVQLDQWVLRRACREAAGWPGGETVSVNVSAASLFAGDLPEEVAAALAEAGLPAHRLKVEITESALLRDPERVRGAIERLRRLGIRVALDDFGSGHASLAYLRDYPVDEIKIDRAFVQGAETDTRTEAFLRAIVGMAGALGVDTIAEGVETERQLSLLRDIGVGALQGFLLGRPGSAAEARSGRERRRHRIALAG